MDDYAIDRVPLTQMDILSSITEQDYLLYTLGLARRDIPMFMGVEINGDKLVVYVNVFGYRRGCWEGKPDRRCDCPGCWITFRASGLNFYVSDDDDDIGHRARIWFDIPPEYRNIIFAMVDGQYDPEELWKSVNAPSAT